MTSGNERKRHAGLISLLKNAPFLDRGPSSTALSGGKPLDFLRLRNGHMTRNISVS
jgi:hypothetical protein